MPTDRLHRRGFTLAEVIISASLGVVFIAAFLAFMVAVARWYRAGEAKSEYAGQIRLLDTRLRPDCAGVGYFAIFDDYPTPAGAGGNKVDPVATRGGNMVVFAQVDASAPLATNPPITRVYGYYADLATDESKAGQPGDTVVTLRRFDSAAPGGAADQAGWRARFPATLDYADPATTLAALVPPASLRRSWPAIAKLDVGAIRLARDAREKTARDEYTGLLNQIFYPRPGILTMNLPIRYGTGDEAYIAPLSLSFSVHK